jgi:negative regulator of flagellin synthesis FlgM
MKVDLNGSTLDRITESQVNSKTGQASESPSTSQVQDTATLSTDSAMVSQLANQVLASSEVRQDKVEALQQAIQRGEYKVEPEKIADAMIRESS